MVDLQYNNMKAYIKAISYYLPQTRISNIDLNNLFPEWSIDKISQKVGINSRHKAKMEESTSSLAVNVANMLFEGKPPTDTIL